MSENRERKYIQSWNIAANTVIVQKGHATYIQQSIRLPVKLLVNANIESANRMSATQSI